MAEIRTAFLFTLELDVAVVKLGDTPYGRRRIAHFAGGRFSGAKLKGRVLPGGSGTTLIRRDDVLELDVRITLETDDQQQLSMSWKGFRHGPKEIVERLERGEAVDPRAYYFRTVPFFETSSATYDWMNRICSVATGTVTASGNRAFDVFQVL